MLPISFKPRLCDTRRKLPTSTLSFHFFFFRKKKTAIFRDERDELCKKKKIKFQITFYSFLTINGYYTRVTFPSSVRN